MGGAQPPVVAANAHSASAAARRTAWLGVSFDCRAVSTARFRPCFFQQESDGRHSISFSVGTHCEDVVFGDDGNPAALVNCTDSGLSIPSRIALAPELTPEQTLLWSGGKSGWRWTKSGEEYCCPGIWLAEPDPSAAKVAVEVAARETAPAQQRTALVAPATATQEIARTPAEQQADLLVGEAEAGAARMEADLLAAGAVSAQAKADLLAANAGAGTPSQLSVQSKAAPSPSPGATQPNLPGPGAAQPTSPGTAAPQPTAAVERVIRAKPPELGSGGDLTAGAGNFDSALVVKMIQTRMGAIQACYQRELKSHFSLEGRVVVQFTIEERGNVSGVKVTENSIGTPVADCVANALQRFRFSPGPQGGSVTFSYPFEFKSTL